MEQEPRPAVGDSAASARANDSPPCSSSSSPATSTAVAVANSTDDLAGRPLCKQVGGGPNEYFTRGLIYHRICAFFPLRSTSRIFLFFMSLRNFPQHRVCCTTCEVCSPRQSYLQDGGPGKKVQQGHSVPYYPLLSLRTAPSLLPFPYVRLPVRLTLIYLEHSPNMR